MRILTVCINYSDLLRVTCPYNSLHGSLLIVTSPDDSATRAYCDSRSISCILSTDHLPSFNKGRLINHGLRRLYALPHDEPILILDADIVLPPVFRLPKLRHDFLYGATRDFESNPAVDIPSRLLKLHGTRIRSEIGVGYFQLFSPQTMRPFYPEGCPNADKSDDAFRLHWKRGKIEALPFQVLHLGPPQVNWKGRVSPLWIPSP